MEFPIKGIWPKLKPFPGRKHMLKVDRRAFLTLAAGTAALPRFAIAQSDTRPEIVIAVQALVTSNTLDPLAEQSNVGERILNSYVELLIGRNLQGRLEAM